MTAEQRRRIEQVLWALLPADVSLVGSDCLFKALLGPVRPACGGEDSGRSGERIVEGDDLAGNGTAGAMNREPYAGTPRSERCSSHA